MRVQLNVTIERWLNLFALDLLFVVMVVLLLFVIIMPMPSHSMYVDLPVSTTAQKSPESAEDLTITIPPRDFFLVIVNENAVRTSDLARGARVGASRSVHDRAHPGGT